MREVVGMVSCMRSRAEQGPAARRGAAPHLRSGLAGLGHTSLCVPQTRGAPWSQHHGPVWMTGDLGRPDRPWHWGAQQGGHAMPSIKPLVGGCLRRGTMGTCWVA